MNRLTYVTGDDWVGIYLNGKLVHQDESITEGRVLRIADDAQPFVLEVVDAEEFGAGDDAWVDEAVGLPFPESLDELLQYLA